MQRLYLSPHTYACETGQQAVFLNLKQDRYTAVAAEDLGALRALIQGWPQSLSHVDSEAETSAVASPGVTRLDGANVIDQLIRADLLTSDRHRGKEANPIDLEPASRTFQANIRPWPQVTPQLLRDFVYSWALVSLALRALPLSFCINRIRRRKASRIGPQPDLNIAKAYMLTTTFFTLQPGFYSANDACLRTSLTLVDFLARQDMYPRLVIGVRMNPFAAHAWVQHESFIFTDTVEHVQKYTPIMLV